MICFHKYQADHKLESTWVIKAGEGIFPSPFPMHGETWTLGAERCIKCGKLFQPDWAALPTDEAINKYINEWEENKPLCQLHEYIGMTLKEYGKWLEGKVYE